MRNGSFNGKGEEKGKHKEQKVKLFPKVQNRGTSEKKRW